MNQPSKSVVLVDDEKAYIDVLANLMSEHLGWNVVTFTKPLDALAALPSLDVGIIITDYYMPKLDGFEFIRRATRIVPDVPFILISGHTIHLPDESFGNLKALRSILPKPFGWRRLADEVIRQAPIFGTSTARVSSDSNAV